MKDAATELLSVLDSLTERVKFCSSDTHGVVLPGLEVDGVGDVGLPVSAATAKKLIRQASQAPYGRGEDTVVDTSIRKVWQVEPSKFVLTNPQWDEFITDIVGAVVEEFAINGRVQASLYKLLIYEQGSFFAPHRDSEKIDGMFATLVVCLPSKHEGGTLLVTHDSQTQRVEFGGQHSAFQTAYAAFYADCQHEITPVASGYRVCLVYNLAQAKQKKQPAAPDNSAAVEKAATLLSEIFADEERDRIAIPFHHQYTESGFDPQQLKGADRARADVLRRAAESLNLDVSLALFTHWQSGSVDCGTLGYDPWRSRRSRYRRWDADDEEDDDIDSPGAEFEEVYDEGRTLDQWFSIDGSKRPFGPMRLAESELLIAPGAELPHTQEIHEATGNEGVSMERWYRQGVIVIWPKSRFIRLLAAEGPRTAVPALEQKLRSRKKSDVEQCREFAAEIIRQWCDDKADWHFGTGGFETRHAQSDGKPLTKGVLSALKKIDDPKLAKRFLSGVLPEWFEGTEGPELVRLLNHFGWKNAAANVRNVFSRLSPKDYRTKIDQPVRLFHDLCCGRGKMTDERRAVCLSCVPAIEQWIMDLDQQRVSRWDDDLDDWDVSDRLTRKSEQTPVRAIVTKLLLLGLNAISDHSGLARCVDYVLSAERHYPAQTVLIPALQAVRKKLKAEAPADDAVRTLAETCVARLEGATETRPEPPADWTRDCDVKCNCADCRELKKFMRDGNVQVLRIAIRKDRRQHLHRQIDSHRLDTTHVTDRRGSPQTLVCTKTQASYERRLKQFETDSQLLVELQKSFGRVLKTDSAKSRHSNPPQPASNTRKKAAKKKKAAKRKVARKKST